MPRRLMVRLRTLTPSIEVRILTGHPVFLLMGFPNPARIPSPPEVLLNNLAHDLAIGSVPRPNWVRYRHPSQLCGQWQCHEKRGWR